MKNCCLTLHSVSGKLFFCLQSRNPNKISPVVRAWRTCFLFVCEELDPYMIFCLAHFQNLPQLSKVTEFNTDLNTRDRQTSSNVCLLKLKEKQQHIKNAIRSQSMASLSHRVALCPCHVHLLQSLQSTCLICTSLQSDVKVCKQPLEG